jgi:hypothetical protein
MSRRNFSEGTDLIHAIRLQTLILGHFGPFYYYTNFGGKTSQSGVINAQNQAIKSRRNFSQWTHPIHPIGLKTHVLGCFRPFSVTVRTSAQNGAKLVPLMHKFAQWSRVWIFRNKRVRSRHWTPNSWFAAFRIVSLLHDLRWKPGETCVVNTQVRAMKSHRIFLLQMHRSTLLDPELMFWDDSEHSITEQISVQIGMNWGH